MARRSYHQRRRFRRARWAPSLQEIGQTISLNNVSTFFQASTLMTNPAGSSSLVSQVYTVKNIEITFNIDLETGGTIPMINNIENLCAYIMYVPQGMTVTEFYNTQHPEYIMAYKYIGSPTNEAASQSTTVSTFGGQQYQPVRVKTRLSRKLQTGDGVILFIKGVNQASTTIATLRVSGLVRWWTKAN